MSSDTFAEVVRWLDDRAADALADHETARKMHGKMRDGLRDALMDELGERAAYFRQAARLLEAAGRECRAVRIREHTESMTGGMYNNLRERVGVARAALDALAPELKEVK